MFKPATIQCYVLSLSEKSEEDKIVGKKGRNNEENFP